MLIYIETHRTCDFPGGGGGSDPLYPSRSAHGWEVLYLSSKVCEKLFRAYVPHSK